MCGMCHIRACAHVTHGRSIMCHGHLGDTWDNESHVSHHKEGDQFEWGRNGGEKRKRRAKGGKKRKRKRKGKGGKERKRRKSVRVKRKERDKRKRERREIRRNEERKEMKETDGFFLRSTTFL